MTPSSHPNEPERDLLRHPEPLIMESPYIPVEIADVASFSLGQYFVRDPRYAVPDYLCLDFIKSREGEAIGSVHYMRQYQADNGGSHYPSNNGLIGVTCVDRIGQHELERLRSLGRLIVFSDGDNVARSDNGEELSSGWKEAF
jgi:hypothetical protein